MHKKNTFIITSLLIIVIAIIFTVVIQLQRGVDTILGLHISDIDGGSLPVLIKRNIVVAGPHSWVEFISNDSKIILEDFVNNKFGYCDFDIVPQDNRYQILCQGPENTRNYTVRSHEHNGQEYIVVEQYDTCTSSECYNIKLSVTK